MNWLTKRVNVALLCAAAALGVTGQGHAAYVVINADPAFGAAFPSLGWRATGAIFVPDTCLADLPNNLNSVVFTPLTNGPCADIRMQDVKVGFYNLADPNVIVEQLNIGSYFADLTPPPDQGNDLTQKLLDITFDANKQVVGFNTSLSLTVQAFSSIAGNGANHFSLEFSSVGARLVAFGSANAPYANRIAESTNTPVIEIGAYTPDGEYRPPGFPVNTVPEPGSLALAGLALLGLALGSRRRA